jgi:hypothetical protein
MRTSHCANSITWLLACAVLLAGTPRGLAQTPTPTPTPLAPSSAFKPEQQSESAPALRLTPDFQLEIDEPAERPSIPVARPSEPSATPAPSDVEPPAPSPDDRSPLLSIPSDISPAASQTSPPRPSPTPRWTTLEEDTTPPRGPLRPPPPPRESPQEAIPLVEPELTLDPGEVMAEIPEFESVEPEVFQPEAPEELQDDTALPTVDDYGEPFFATDGLRARIGPIRIGLGFSASYQYNDNIFATREDPQSDYITTLSPKILVNLGAVLGSDATLEEIRANEAENYFRLSYTPGFQYFQRNPDQNTIDQRLILDGRYIFSKYRTSLAASYIRTEDPQANTLGRIRTDLYAATWSNFYDFSAKTYIQLDLATYLADYDPGLANETYQASAFIGYTVSEKLRFSVGPSVGITFVEGGQRQPYQTLQLNVEYNTLSKLVFSGSFGVQSRQFTGANTENSESLLTPVFTLAATYRPFDSTTLTLNLSRSVSSGSFGDTYVNTNIAFNARQRFFQHLFFELYGNYQILEYQNIPVERSDNFITISPRLSYKFHEDEYAVSVFYRYTQRTSENFFANYDNNVIGIELALQF